jgi:ABC-type transporter Mla subunit MlaD
LNSTSVFDFIKISNLNKLVKSIVDTSKKLSAVKFNSNISKNLSDMISNMRKFYHFKNNIKYSFGKSSIDLIVSDMVRISKKFALNSKYFANNISPDYMKNIMSNISSYIKLLKMVEKSQKSGFINDKTFNNKSINNITDGIVKMAKTFDRLSKSLNKFTNSIKTIDTQKLKQLNVLTANISTLSGVDSKSLESVLKVLESKSAALSKIVEGKNKSESKDKNKNVNQKKSPLGVNTKGTSVIGKAKRSPEEVKLDMVVKLLYNLNTLFSPGSTFDDFIFKKMSEKGK